MGGLGLGLLLEGETEVRGFVVDLAETFGFVLQFFGVGCLHGKQSNLLHSHQPPTKQPNPLQIILLIVLNSPNHQPDNANIHLLLPILNNNQPDIRQKQPTCTFLAILKEHKIIIGGFDLLPIEGFVLLLEFYG